MRRVGYWLSEKKKKRLNFEDQIPTFRYASQGCNLVFQIKFAAVSHCLPRNYTVKVEEHELFLRRFHTFLKKDILTEAACIKDYF